VNGYVVEVTHDGAGKTWTTGSPISLNGELRREAPPAPELGQHTEEVMLEAGYSWEDIARIRDSGAL
jgi:formyl-CoA transferase